MIEGTQQQNRSHGIMATERLSTLIRSAEIIVSRMREVIEDLEIFPRRSSYLDPVVTALLNRAFNTHKSVSVICNSQAGADAYVLARVIVEILIVIRWLTNAESEKRARKFGEFEGKLIQRAIEMIRTGNPSLHIPQHPEQDLIDEAAMKYQGHIYWAGPLSTLAEEDDRWETTGTGSPLNLSWYYRVPYFVASWYVHSNVMGVRSLTPQPLRPIKFLDDNDESLCQQALVLSTNCLALILIRIDKVWDLGIADLVEQLWRDDFLPLL